MGGHGRKAVGGSEGQGARLAFAEDLVGGIEGGQLGVVEGLEVEKRGAGGGDFVLGDPVLRVCGSGGRGEDYQAAGRGAWAARLGKGEEGGPVGPVLIGLGAEEDLGAGRFPNPDHGADQGRQGGFLKAHQGEALARELHQMEEPVRLQPQGGERAKVRTEVAKAPLGGLLGRKV